MASNARIAEALAAIGAVRARALDAGVKIAVENHAGDMQARELKTLVEQAGPDLVGVCLDAGNAFWAMEDPRVALETLAPYVLTSHTRDTAVRPTADGAEVAWTRMGDGNIGIDQYLDRFRALCPDLPVMLEIIVMPAPRPLPYRDEQFRAGYPRMTESEFQRSSPRRARPAAARRRAPSTRPQSSPTSRRAFSGRRNTCDDSSPISGFQFSAR